ncbi:hypothetical protein WA026_004378 [Henosepilachna vigintioctopunctata]|uniref:Uncharacterized protein n=1 Tax=Henosepilachna vigintioctopunctata TaxID=420089 RepID=A0AAW1V370_9CUCU
MTELCVTTTAGVTFIAVSFVTRGVVERIRVGTPFPHWFHSVKKRELAEYASELDLQLQKVGRILNTRWVFRSFETVMAVWYGYQA